jgi:hypothetical protein
MRETKSVRHGIAGRNNMLWWGKGEYQVLGKEKCLVYKRSRKRARLSPSLNHHYRLVEAMQPQEVNMSILSSTGSGSAADSAGSASSLQPVEHRQVQEQDRCPSG